MTRLVNEHIKANYEHEVLQTITIYEPGIKKEDVKHVEGNKYYVVTEGA